MNDKIEGVPEGWRLVRIGLPRIGVDWVINHEQSPAVCVVATSCVNWPIIEKIEQPKKYRPFANAKEFEPHRDRWWRFKDGINESLCKTITYSDRSHNLQAWDKSLEGKVFEDGSPFGVEI